MSEKIEKIIEAQHSNTNDNEVEYIFAGLKVYDFMPIIVKDIMEELSCSENL